MTSIKSARDWTSELTTSLSTMNVVLVLILVGIIVFINTISNGFVWDDIGYITNNADVQSFHLSTLFGSNSFNTGLIYRPVALIFYGFMYRVFGTFPLGYHLVSIGIHIINAVLVYLIFSKFFTRLSSLFLSLIFLVHPMQVESVTYIAAVDGTLAFLLGMVAFLMETTLHKTTWISHIGAALLILTSILLKEIGALFIIGIIGYHICWNSSRKKIFLLTLSYLALSLGYLYLRLFVGHVPFTASRTQIVPIAGLDLSHRLISVPSIVLYYLTTFIYPARLAIDQQWVVTSVRNSHFYIPLFILGAIILSIGTIMLKNKKAGSAASRSALFFACWLVVSLSLHLQLFPLDMTVADRFFYLPIVGLLGLVASLFSMIRLKISPVLLPIIGLIGCLCILALSVRTIIRNRDWRDEITLYSHDSHVENSFNIENNLGRAYFIQKNYDAALPHFVASARMLPTELNTYNIGATYEELGDLTSAETNYKHALTLNKFPPDEHKMIALIIIKKLAWISLLSENYSFVTPFIRQQLTIYPSDAQLWESLAISEYLSNENDQAVRDILNAQKYMKNPSINSQYLRERITRGEPIRIK